MLLYSLARIAFGVGLVVAPRRVASGWLAADAQRPATQVAVRGLGVRDVALAGAVLVADDPRAPLALCVACDVADIAATLAAGDALPPRARWGTVALAGTSAAIGTALAARS